MSVAMWRDPYLLGFMNFTASFFARAETKGSAKPEEMGFGLQDAFTTVSNMNGVEIIREVVGLSESGDPEFVRGLDDAAAVAYYNLGLLKDEEAHPLVLQCTPLAKSMIGSLGGDMRSNIGGAMMQATFGERVRALRGSNA
jgi:hypothetical protein